MRLPVRAEPFVKLRRALSKRERVSAAFENFPSILRQAQDERKILPGSYL